MPTLLPTREAQQHSNRRPSPRIDRFGAWISAVVLVGSVTAAFVMRQNIDDHIYNVANARHAATTGSALADR